MGTCVNCKYAGRPTYKSPCSECKGYSKYEAVEIRTNADRIRAMSDEELAVMLAKEIPHGDCWGCRLECGVCDGDKFDNGCMNGFYKWLKQPAEGS